GYWRIGGLRQWVNLEFFDQTWKPDNIQKVK
ncbi:unnamed protein product, partial [marine sediment metagenome]